MKIEFLIVTKNCESCIYDCLSSIYKNINDPIIKIFDNNSFDKTVEIIKSNFKDIYLFESSKNVGFAKGINFLFKKVCTNYFVVLNPDTEIISNFNFIFNDKKFLNSEVVVASLNQYTNSKLTRNYNLNPSIEYFFLKFIFFDKIYFFIKNKVSKKSFFLSKLFYLDGSFLIIKKNLLVRKDFLFLSKFFIFYEDVEFSNLLANHQKKIIIYPQFSYHHIRSQSFNFSKYGLIRKQIFMNKSRYDYMKIKYKNNYTYILFIFLSLLLAYVKISYLYFGYYFRSKIEFKKNEYMFVLNIRYLLNEIKSIIRKF